MPDPTSAPQDDFVAPVPKAVAPGALRRWLVAGWHDLAAAPGPSLFYGAVLAGMGFLLTNWFAGEGMEIVRKTFRLGKDV